MSQEHIDELENYASSDVFSPRQRVALEYAERITMSDQDVDEAFFAEVQREFEEPAAIVELTAIIAFENFRSKFNHALLIDSNGFCTLPRNGGGGGSEPMLERPTVGIHLPGASTSTLPSGAEYAKFCREAEALGFDSLWVEDRVFHPTHVADSLTLLTWAAANTEQMLLGTAVLLLNLRRAPLVARQISTLRHLAGDRVALGVSIGGSPEEYAALGVPFDRRVGVFREGIEALRELADSASVRPAALNVPVLIGGAAPAAIRRAGELGDGWIMSPFGDLEDFERGRMLAREGAEAAERDPDALIYGRLLYVAVDDNSDRNRVPNSPRSCTATTATGSTWTSTRSSVPLRKSRSASRNTRRRASPT